MGIHLRGHSQGHESRDLESLSYELDISRSPKHNQTQSVDLPSGADEGTLSCDQIASLDSMVLGMLFPKEAKKQVEMPLRWEFCLMTAKCSSAGNDSLFVEHIPTAL